MIKIEQVTKSFKGIEVFNNISLNIEDGQKVYIKGVNGSGKSVLLKLIVGYSKPNSGSVIVDGVTIGKDRDFIENAGISINAPEFIKNDTGIENLLELARIRKVAKECDIRDLAKLLEFDTDINKKYATYSLGMKQKMRIIQAIMDKPKYLILDEPFDALDKHIRKEVVELLEQYMKDDPTRTLIFTSHNDEMASIADVVYEVNNRDLHKAT